MTTHLKTPWTEKPGRVWSVGSQRVRYDRSNLAHKPYIIFLNLDLRCNKKKTVKENGKHGEKKMNGIIFSHIFYCAPFKFMWVNCFS